MGRAFVWSCVGVILITMSTQSSLAQTTTAALRGVVTDGTGAVLPGTTIEVSGPTGPRTTESDDVGFYRFANLTPGTYTMTVLRDGFGTQRFEGVELSLDRTVTIDMRMTVAQAERVTVQADAPAHDRSRSSQSSVVSSRSIAVIPVNTRNYLDLIRLTPGVVVNAPAGESGPTSQDTTGAIFGERAGNTSFLVDGLWNNDAFQGGPLQSLTQDAVQQFEVIGAGYAAEFGQGSGGVVNVITRSGTNRLTGGGFVFVRNDALDTSNVEGQEAPELSRANVGFTIGGPLQQDRAWYFGSVEHVHEDRAALFPLDVPAPLAAMEDFSRQPEMRDYRLLGKYTRQLSPQHHLQVVGGWNSLDQRNRLQSGTALPSASDNLKNRTYLGSGQLTSQVAPRAVLETTFGARGQSLDGTATSDARSFSALFFDTLQTFQFGAPVGSVRTLDQRYYTARSSLTYVPNSGHSFKGGIEYTWTAVDGRNDPGLVRTLVTSSANFDRFGVDGFQITQGVGFPTAEDSLTDIGNHGVALFLQDSWRPWSSVTLNLGVRYDLDSVFRDTNNVAPRLGVAWAPNTETIVRASWGLFYDRYRLGLAHAVPEFGGFDGRTVVEAAYPRLVADARPFGIGALGVLARDPLVLHRQFGIPVDAVVTRDNITQLTGLSPDEFLGQLSAFLGTTGVPFLPVDFSPYTGFLRQDLSAAFQDEIRVAESFETPLNRTLSIGIERQIQKDWTVGADYVHRDIENILGLRIPNLSPVSRVIGAPITSDGAPLFRTYGPWYDGNYDAMVLSLKTGPSDLYEVTASYTLAEATDNLLNSNLLLGIATQGAGSVPTDNLNLEFDRGNSDLSVRHAFVASGFVQLPWDVVLSGIMRATSGAFFSAAGEGIDYDGDGIQSGRPRGTTRNEFVGPNVFNLDVRVEKGFVFGRGHRVAALVEFFNLTNARHPLLIDSAYINNSPGPNFGSTRVPLPGREIQLGARVAF